MAKKKALPAGHSFDTGCRCEECKYQHYSALGKRGGDKNKARHGKNHFSNLAKKSHPKNNPEAQRPFYTGGRPKGSVKKVDVADSAGTQ